MSRKSASVRREEILAATIEEIETTGLRALRVADVADRLGLSPSLVIYHFVTKEALVAAAFAQAGENDLYRARGLAAGRKPARQRLGDVVRWYMPTGSTRSWKIWIDGWSAGLFDPDVRSTFAALDLEWKTILAGLITDGIDTGEIRSDVVGEETATRILAYLDGLAIQLIFNPDSVSPATLSDWVEKFVAGELGATSDWS